MGIEQAAMDIAAGFKPAIVDVGVVSWEFDWEAMRFTSVSPAAEQLLGFPVDDWYRESFWYNCIHPDDRDAALAFCRAATQRFKDHQFQYRMVHADGSTRWIHDIVSIDQRSPIMLRGMFVDVTAQHRAREAAVASEARFQRLADEAPVFIWMTNADGRCTFFNQTWKRFAGSSPDAPVDGLWNRLLHPDDCERAVDGYNVAHEHRIPFESQYRLRRQDGTYRWLLDRGIPRYEAGDFVGYMGSATDINERVESEELLRESEARFRFLAENARDMIARFSADGQYLYVSPACQTILGRTQEEVLGHHAWEFIHPDDLDRIRSHHEGVLSGIPQTAILRKRHADGHDVWCETSVHTVQNDEAGRLEIVGVTRDISQRKRAEDRLRDTARRLQVTIDSVPAMIAHVDADQRFRYCNKLAGEVLGVRVEHIVGRTPAEALPPEIAETVTNAVLTALSGVEVDHNLTVRHHDRERTYRLNCVPERYGSGQPVTGCFVLARDITDRHNDKIALRTALAKQDELMRELNHRVKNSLGGLLTLVDLCERSYPTVGAFADAMRRRIRAQANIHAVLTTNRYESLDLAGLIRVMLPPDVPGRAALEGPPVSVPSRQATPMGFVIQELMSNSLLHGALGDAGGSLEISWTATPVAETDSVDVVIDWREQGIPPKALSPPGTGTRLIEGFMRHELGGSVAFNYAQGSLHHTLRAQLRPPAPAAVQNSPS